MFLKDFLAYLYLSRGTYGVVFLCFNTCAHRDESGQEKYQKIMEYKKQRGNVQAENEFCLEF
jgi:hypothetical protein